MTEILFWWWVVIRTTVWYDKLGRQNDKNSLEATASRSMVMYGQDPPMPHPTPVITLPPPPTYLAMQSLDPNKICPLLCRFVDHSQPIHPHRSLKLVSLLLLTSSCGNYCEKYSIFFFFFCLWCLHRKKTSLEEGAIPTANEQRKKQ